MLCFCARGLFLPPHENSLRAPGTVALDQTGKGEQRTRSARQGQETGHPNCLRLLDSRAPSLRRGRAKPSLYRSNTRLCFQHSRLPFRPLPCPTWPTTCGNGTGLNDPTLPRLPPTLLPFRKPSPESYLMIPEGNPAPPGASASPGA